MKFEVTILGSGSATPTLKRNPSSQYVYVDERHFLIDCGEGTQLQLRHNKIKFSKINHIFISHLHGDHYLGLMGLISSFHLLGRTKELHIFAPNPLKDIIKLNLKASGTYLKYPLFIHEIDTKLSQVLFEDSSVKVSSFPLKHRVPCMGFKIEEKEKPLSIKKEMIESYSIPLEKMKNVKAGEDLLLDNGDIIPNEKLTHPRAKLRAYAYCSDTAYYEGIVEHLSGTTTLYHEATFLDNLKDRAKQTQHSTAKQAAEVALKSKVEQLLIGHFSARYKEVDVLEKEAQTIFQNTRTVEDNQVFEII